MTDLATRLRRVGGRDKDTSDATPDIAGLQENDNIGAIDWAVLTIGYAGAELKQCKSRITHGEAAQVRRREQPWCDPGNRRAKPPATPGRRRPGGASQRRSFTP